MNEHDGIALALVEVSNLNIAVMKTRHQQSRDWMETGWSADDR
jgi:hypothetical protein